MELRLAVNAGSIQEDNDQLGYAHFIEHMAFNGTTHFKKNELVKYLQSIGVRFGADLNAYTSFDETVYQLSVPTDTARLVEQAFTLVLEDWAHGQLFDSTEVVNERGVVLEEWRSALGAGERMQRAFIPIILKDSRYAIRIPIGTPESIERAQPSVLRRFYHDWYRPDLMAVVVVGDIDVKEVEATIKKHFSGIPRVANERARTSAVVPDNVAPLVAITTDAEMSSSSFLVGYKRPLKPVATVGEYRQQIVEGLYFSMLGARLSEMSRKPDAPFLNAGVGNGSFFARDVDALTFSASVKDGGIERGAEAVLVEARRVDQFGFLPAELQRAKDNTLRSYERMYAERAKTNSDQLVDELVRNFLEQEDIPGIDVEYRLTQQLLPTITVTDVNTLASKWITDENRIILVRAPLKSGVPVPTQAQILAVLDRANKAPVTAYTENVSDAPLVARMPTPGRVVSTKAATAAGVTEWKLSNGVRVLVKPTDFKADEVLMSAYSPGGNSLVSDADYMSATYIGQIVGGSGVGTYNATDLQKKLSGKTASAGASVGQTSEGLSGSASPKDIETMFQLIYLRFTAPRLDTAAWLALKARTEAGLANRGVVPINVYIDTLSTTMNMNKFRSRPPSLATFAEVSPEKAFAIYKDRFSNAGDFTFVFVGSFALDSLKPLVEKYIGSLPSTGRVENWKDVGDGAPPGVVEKTVLKGTEPVAISSFIFTAPFTYTPKDRVDLNALTTLSQMWMLDALREELGATYSPQIGGGPSRIPRTESQIVIQYQSSPDNVDKLSKRVFTVIDSLKKYGPTDADMTKIKEQILRSRETQLKTNSYWISGIGQRDQAGEDIVGLLTAYDDLVKALTPQQLKDAAKKYFDVTHYVKIVLLPEKKAQ